MTSELNVIDTQIETYFNRLPKVSGYLFTPKGFSRKRDWFYIAFRLRLTINDKIIETPQLIQLKVTSTYLDDGVLVDPIFKFEFV